MAHINTAFDKSIVLSTKDNGKIHLGAGSGINIPPIPADKIKRT